MDKSAIYTNCVKGKKENSQKSIWCVWDLIILFFIKFIKWSWSVWLSQNQQSQFKKLIEKTANNFLGAVFKYAYQER